MLAKDSSSVVVFPTVNSYRVVCKIESQWKHRGHKAFDRFGLSTGEIIPYILCSCILGYDSSCLMGVPCPPFISKDGGVYKESPESVTLSWLSQTLSLVFPNYKS